MNSKVFLSCGQRPGEKEVALKVGKLLENRGFEVYIAIDVQTILEINADIIRELKDSDYYLFINFVREPIDGGHRGSLFSNQELAIAYALGFERILVINQDGIRPEGMLAYIGVNSEFFHDFIDCCDVVERALDRSRWTNDYSRRLRADTLRFSNEIIAYGGLAGRFLYLDIRNNRPDIAALEATAKLTEYSSADPQAWQRSRFRSPLKATGRPGFSHTIFPKSHEAFDLLCVGSFSRPDLQWRVPALSGALVPSPTAYEEPGVFLNSALDVVGSQRLPVALGVWLLRYQFFAIGFPVLQVCIELTLPNWSEPSARLISEEVI
jgi:hypothetical protein